MDQSALVAAVEALLAAVEAGGGEAVAPAEPELSGNRTEAVTDYDGGDSIQDLVDVARRFIRYSREGKKPSQKERFLARDVLKDIKEGYDILNTNGNDVWTHAGL